MSDHIRIFQMGVQNDLMDLSEGPTVQVGMEFKTSDPFALHMKIYPRGLSEPYVLWVFGRDILHDVLAKDEAQGFGDIVVWLDHENQQVGHILMRSPYGQAVLTFDAPEMRGWLKDTYRHHDGIVPSEELDAEADRLLRS